MDDRQIAANLEAARAKSRSIADDLKNWKAEAGVLEADYVRAQHLWDLGLISQEQLQHAQYKAESDQWDIKRVQETLNTSHEEERSLELELAKTKIVAPFSGVIARRYVREGQEVNKGERLFWVTAEAPLLMRFTLPEKYFGHVRTGHVFEVTSPDVPNEQHGARVKEISPVIDPSSGTFEVLVELTGEPGSLRPGMTANLKVENNQPLNGLMNLTRVLNNALPELPARVLAERPPRIDPEANAREHIEEGKVDHSRIYPQREKHVHLSAGELETCATVRRQTVLRRNRGDLFPADRHGTFRGTDARICRGPG